MSTLPKDEAVYVMCRPCLRGLISDAHAMAGFGLYITKDWDVITCPHLHNAPAVAEDIVARQMGA